MHIELFQIYWTDQIEPISEFGIIQTTKTNIMKYIAKSHELLKSFAAHAMMVGWMQAY